MKIKPLFRDLIPPLLIFFILSFFSNYLFFFQDAELIKDIKDSEFWLKNIRNGKFSNSKGYLYLDNLNRSREYKLDIRLKTYRDITLHSLELDKKPIDFQVSLRRIIHKNGILSNIYQISAKISRSEAKRAILAFNLSIPGGSSRKHILDNTKLVSARLSLSDGNSEVKRFIYSSIFSILIGFLIFLVFRFRVPKKIVALLAGVDGLLASVFFLNVYDFRYVYILAARRMWFFIFFFVLSASIIAGGYILYVSYKDKKLAGKQLENKITEGFITKLSVFIKQWNRTDLFLIISLGLLLLIISAYTFTNDFYIDDYLWLRDYKSSEMASTFIGPVDSTGCLPKYYRPLPLLLFQGQYKLFGETYAPYYVFRFLHLFLNCLFIFYIVKKITNNSYSAFCSGLWVAASIYSFSASAWLSSLFDVMMISFALLSVLILISNKSGYRLFWVFVCLAASLMTKESSVMLPLVLLSAGLLFCFDKITSMIRFYFSIAVVTGAYLFLRILFWGGLGGMEDKHDFYSVSNIPSLFTRLGEITGLIFISPGSSPNGFELIAGWILRSLFIAFLIFCIIFFVIKKKNIIVSNDFKLILFGFSWIIFFSLPILFPFTLIRLGYILIPGAAFVIGGAISLISKNLHKKNILYILLLFLALVLAQQVVSHLRIGYEKYGKGAYFRNNKSESLYETWRNNLPMDSRERWYSKINENK